MNVLLWDSKLSHTFVLPPNNRLFFRSKLHNALVWRYNIILISISNSVAWELPGCYIWAVLSLTYICTFAKMCDDALWWCNNEMMWCIRIINISDILLTSSRFFYSQRRIRIESCQIAGGSMLEVVLCTLLLLCLDSSVGARKVHINDRRRGATTLGFVPVSGWSNGWNRLQGRASSSTTKIILPDSTWRRGSDPGRDGRTRLWSTPLPRDYYERRGVARYVYCHLWAWWWSCLC